MLLAFFSLKRPTIQLYEIVQFFSPSSSAAFRKGIFSCCGFYNQIREGEKKLITDVYRLLNQILVRMNERNVHRARANVVSFECGERKTCFQCSTSLTNSGIGVRVTLALGPPLHETKNVHILIVE